MDAILDLDFGAVKLPAFALEAHFDQRDSDWHCHEEFH